MRIIVALVVVGLAAAAIGWQKELFAERTPIYILTDGELGISKGIPVEAFGVTVGSVDGIEIVPGGANGGSQVRVRLSIASKYLQLITRDSRAHLLRDGTAGQSLIEIVPGAERAQPVAANGVINFERAKSLGGLSEDLSRILTQVKQAIAVGQSPETGPQRQGALQNP